MIWLTEHCYLQNKRAYVDEKTDNKWNKQDMQPSDIMQSERI